MLSVLFSYKGRINRAQYWLGIVVLCVFLFVAFFVMAMSAGPALLAAKMGDVAAVMQAMSSAGIIFVLTMIVYCWCALAIQTKRFHDRGRSGAWMFLPMAAGVPLFMTLVGGIMAGKPGVVIAQESMLWINLLGLINLGMLVDLGFMPGKEGPNKYGDPPGGARSSPSPTAQTPAPGRDKEVSAAVSSLLGAQSAMDRAIAERERQAQQPAAPVVSAARAPASAPRAASGGAPSFGRRATQ